MGYAIKKPITVCCIFLILMLMFSCAKKPVYQIRVESPDYLTGLSYNQDVQIRYRFTTDDQYFYIRFDSERRDLGFQLMDKGLNLYIDTTLRQRPSFSLSYPLPATDGHRPLPESMEEKMNGHRPAIKVTPVALLKVGDMTHRFNTDSIPLAGLFSVTEEPKSGRFIYRAAIPWTNFPDGEEFRKGRPFMVGIELSKAVTGMEMRSMPERGRGGGMPQGGEGGGRNLGGGAPGGMMPGSRPEGSESSDFSPDGHQGMTPDNQTQRKKLLTEPYTLWIGVTTNPIL